jgi:hypothetical protein
MYLFIEMVLSDEVVAVISPKGENNQKNRVSRA